MCQGGDCTAGDPSMEKFMDKNSVADHAQNQILAAARLREYWKELLDLELSDTTDIIRNKETTRPDRASLRPGCPVDWWSSSIMTPCLA